MIKTYRPTSPGIRQRKTLVKGVEAVKPLKKLTKGKKGPSGRSKGRITVRHRQRGAKKLHRLVDFKRDKKNIDAKVASIEDDPNNPYLHLILGHYYNGILNDDINYLKHSEIAFKLDSTSSYYAKWYFDSLLDNHEYKKVFKMINDDELKSIFGKDGKDRVSYQYYLAIENYEKAMECLQIFFKENNKNDIFYKAEIFALKGDKNSANNILNKYEMDYNNKAKIFAILNEKDSMYYYLSKLTKINQIITLNGMDEVFGKYSNEPEYKRYLKNHYLPITSE